MCEARGAAKFGDNSFGNDGRRIFHGANRSTRKNRRQTKKSVDAPENIGAQFLIARETGMAKLGETPKIKYVRKGDGYEVYLGDDRIGFVKRVVSSTWRAVDTTGLLSFNAATRGEAAGYLRRRFVQRKFAGAVRTGGP